MKESIITITLIHIISILKTNDIVKICNLSNFQNKQDLKSDIDKKNVNNIDNVIKDIVHKLNNNIKYKTKYYSKDGTYFLDNNWFEEYINEVVQSYKPYIKNVCFIANLTSRL